MDNLIVIAVISILLTVSPFISNFSRIPVAVVEILLGALAVYFGVFEKSLTLEVLAKVGFLYLMFLAGMEVDLKSLLNINKIMLRKVFSYFMTLYFLSFCIFMYFELPLLYLVALPIVSVGMIMTMVKEYGKKEEWLKTSLLIGIFGELLSIAALVILDGVLIHGIGVEFYHAMFVLVAFILVTIGFFRALKIIFWWFPEIKLRIMPFEDSRNQDIRFSMTIFFIMLAMMIYLDLEMALGAFLAGMFIVSFFEHKKELPHKLSAFGFGFMVPIFFIYIGSTLDLNMLFSQELMRKVGFVIMAMIFMHLCSALIAFYRSMGPKHTLLMSMSNSMPLTFLVAIATIGFQNQAIGKEDYYVLITAAMLQALIMMMLIKLGRYVWQQMERKNQILAQKTS